MAARATMIDFARPARKNLVLLAAIIVLQVVQPLLGHRSVEAGAFFDIVFAAICLYVFFVVFGALVWANLYLLSYLLYPEAFIVKAEIAWRLDRWHTRRSLFDYLSFTTLTGLGYSDISPGGPPVYSLTWMEVIFGQFYMAVVVAQLVGLKLAQAMKGDGPEST